MAEGRKGREERTSGVKCSALCCASLICPFDENITRTGEHETGSESNSNSRRSRRSSNSSRMRRKPKKTAARTHPGQQKVFFNLIFFTFHFCVSHFLMKLKIIKRNSSKDKATKGGSRGVGGCDAARTKNK